MTNIDIETPTTNNLAKSLLNAQKQIKRAKKDAKNPFYKSSYATIENVIEAVKKALNDNGIVFLQPLSSDENGVYVNTTLIHESGESITSRMRIIPAKENDPQAQGSAITYARRYSLQSMMSLPAEDDDGEKAMARPKTSYPASTSSYPNQNTYKPYQKPIK